MLLSRLSKIIATCPQMNEPIHKLTALKPSVLWNRLPTKRRRKPLPGSSSSRSGAPDFIPSIPGKVIDANSAMSRSYSDFAVLYRTNEQHRMIEQVFERAGIPFQIASRETALNQKGFAGNNFIVKGDRRPTAAIWIMKTSCGC
jgi:hypothetical protein